MKLPSGSITELGVYGIFAILVIREVIGFAKYVIEKRKTNNETASSEVVECPIAGETVAKQVDELFKMHDVKDEDGVYRWHNRRSVERAILEQTDIMKTLAIEIRNSNTRIERHLIGE